jgi:hypothetical protein
VKIIRWDVCWLLVGGVALGASLAGHALQLRIESAHLFGGARALYTHSLQTPLGFLLLALFFGAAFCIARGLIENAHDERDATDWLEAALSGICRIQPARLIAMVIGLQFAALIGGELTEMALSSYDNISLSAIFGAGHASAPFVYVLVGLLFALALRSFARAACTHAAAIRHFVLVAIARAARPAQINCAPLLRAQAHRTTVRAPLLLAHHIASRPPPALLALVA